jgi:MoaA/NifB/PqqE/SkfB family radical SAM enzyme
MFKFENLKTIHLEISNNCQAKCPMCARNHHSGLPNPLLKLNNWTLGDFKEIITEEVLSIIEKIYFCGNFGDPLLNDDLISMCEYLKNTNPNIHVSIHTNGAARKTSWWKDLYKALPSSHIIHFAIDGLEDTHHIYRVGTKYEDVIRNAVAFIQEGGIAEWTFIKFKHNEHQVSECRERAKFLGFNKFQLKSSSRFLGEPTYNVLDKFGNITHILELPSDDADSFLDSSTINSYKDLIKDVEINCLVQESKEIYIDAHKKLLPCCWLSSIPTTYYAPTGFVSEQIVKDINNQYNNLIIDLGGKDRINAKLGIKNILESKEWQSVWKKYWNEEKLITCSRVCGKFKTVKIPQPQDQFIDLDQF